jgi:hypothetical protein
MLLLMLQAQLVQTCLMGAASLAAKTAVTAAAHSREVQLRTTTMC